MTHEKLWCRTCQECGHVQRAKQPKVGEITDSYANSKCRKCGSEALDYGHDGFVMSPIGIIHT
jgi:hypothetical protein